MCDWRQTLTEIIRDCAEPNWDAYGAEPISAGAVKHAISVLRCIEREPDIAPEPDGSIGIEWRNDEGTLVVVSISECGKCDWVVLYGKRGVAR